MYRYGLIDWDAFTDGFIPIRMICSQQVESNLLLSNAWSGDYTFPIRAWVIGSDGRITDYRGVRIGSNRLGHFPYGFHVRPDQLP